MKDILKKVDKFMKYKLTEDLTVWKLLLIILIPALSLIGASFVAHIIYYLFMFVIFIFYILFMNMPPQNPIS